MEHMITIANIALPTHAQAQSAYKYYRLQFYAGFTLANQN